MDFSNLFEKAKDFQNYMEVEQKKLKDKEFKGVSGGGAAVVVIDGLCNIKSVAIDKKFLSPENQEIISDLISAAFNSAKKEFEEFSSESMASLFSKNFNL